MTEEANPLSPENRIKELEDLIAAKDTEINSLRQSQQEWRDGLAKARAENVAILTGYRELLLSQHPGIEPEMLHGENIAAINASLAKAREIRAKIKQSVLQELAQNHVPSGAPGRQPPETTTLSPREKINYAVGGKH